MNTDNKAYYLPWIPVFGVIAGVIGGIPTICCCTCGTGPFLFSLLAGLLAVKMIVDKGGVTMSSSEAAIVGALVGIAAGGLGGIMSAALSFASGGARVNTDQLRNVPPEMRRWFTDGNNKVMGAIFSGGYVLFSGLLGAVVGALIGAATFKKTPPPGAGGFGGGGYPQQQPGGFPQNQNLGGFQPGGFQPGPGGFQPGPGGFQPGPGGQPRE